MCFDDFPFTLPSVVNVWFNLRASCTHTAEDSLFFVVELANQLL